eukprot:3278412-Rhodomonas_salina.2
MVLRACYGMRGTEAGYGGTRRKGEAEERERITCYEAAQLYRHNVLRGRAILSARDLSVSLRACYAMTGTKVA